MGKSKKKMGVKKGSPQAQNFLNRTQRKIDAKNLVIFQDGMQNALDIASLALRAEFGFGPERLHRFGLRFERMFSEVQQANIEDGRDDKDAWYSDEKFEASMKEAWGPYYQTREVRYAEI